MKKYSAIYVKDDPVGIELQVVAANMMQALLQIVKNKYEVEYVVEIRQIEEKENDCRRTNEKMFTL